MERNCRSAFLALNMCEVDAIWRDRFGVNMRRDFVFFFTLIALQIGVGCQSEQTSSSVERSQDETPSNQPVTASQTALGEAYPKEAPVPSERRSFPLRAAPTQVQLFDGQVVDVWSYNGQVPGPVLRVRLGEEVEVRLQNDLPQPTTIHWHGVRVPNAMDGVPGITQDPIQPGESFTYRFVPKDAGTFWFHPHVRGAEQVERGLYGVLIVDDAVSLPYSRDEVWVVDDWRMTPEGAIDPNFVTRHDLAHDGRWGQRVTVNGDVAKEMVVRPGERIRLRLVNTSNARVYRPDFGGLVAQVIAVDGMYTSAPIAAVGFELAPGNRLDVDIVIPQDAAGSSFAVVDRFTRQQLTLATIKVEGAPVPTPIFASPFNPNILDWHGVLDSPADLDYRLNARRGGKYGIEWLINDRPWGEHEVTELVGGKLTHARFSNESGRLHPMHIHGQFFMVIGRNGKRVDEPYFRDTVLLHGRESVDIAMVPIDWGRWLMHCHILEHAESGMMTEIRVGK